MKNSRHVRKTTPKSPEIFPDDLLYQSLLNIDKKNVQHQRDQKLPK